MKKWLLLTAVLGMAACSSIDCPVQNIVATVYTFKNADGTADTLRYDTLTVTTRRADGHMHTLLNSSTGTSQMQLPVSLSNPTDTLILTVGDTLKRITTDTIYLHKTDQPHFESVDCNLSYFHYITSVTSTHQRIDSIVLVNPTVNYDLEKEHMHIYFKARY